jgi:ketosteroid isomerase-like protein
MDTHNMINTGLSCLLLACAAAVGASAQDSQQSKLIVLEHLWNEAQVHRDAGALSDLVGDRFIDTEFDGEVSDRKKFLSDIGDPQFKPNAMTLQDLKVDLYQNAAIVTGTYRAKGSYNGKPYDHVGRFTDAWMFEKDRWRCVASHSSLLKK